MTTDPAPLTIEPSPTRDEILAAAACLPGDMLVSEDGFTSIQLSHDGRWYCAIRDSSASGWCHGRFPYRTAEAARAGAAEWWEADYARYDSETDR